MGILGNLVVGNRSDKSLFLALRDIVGRYIRVVFGEVGVMRTFTEIGLARDSVSLFRENFVGFGRNEFR